MTTACDGVWRSLQGFENRIAFFDNPLFPNPDPLPQQHDRRRIIQIQLPHPLSFPHPHPLLPKNEPLPQQHDKRMMIQIQLPNPLLQPHPVSGKLLLLQPQLLADKSLIFNPPFKGTFSILYALLQKVLQNCHKRFLNDCI